MACLDSDFLVAFLRGDKAAEEKMAGLGKRFEKLTVTPIVATELFTGAFKSKRENAVEKVKNVLSVLQLLEFNLAAAAKAGQIMHYLDNTGQKIGEKDAMIAAIAITHGQPLVTRNKKHFSKIKELRIEEW